MRGLQEYSPHVGVRMTKPTPIYLAIMLEVERRRQQVGISQDRICELMGTAERSYAKALHPDNPSGRCATWPTLQAAIDVLFCEGFDLRLVPGTFLPRTTEGTKRLIRAEAAHWNASAKRQWMAEIGRRGGKARVAKLTPEQRRQSAIRAITARWANHTKPASYLAA